MAYDLVIKNGTVVDGSGGPRYQADIGIKDGKVVEKGRLTGGARVIDAKGKIVAPGFVDIHTHYDAQIMWDPLLTCSPWHGVTTVVMGNCGFTMAPCQPQDRDYINRLFARVEGMNLAALQNGVDWRWRSFPEYLDFLGGRKLGINAATLVGHSAVRRFVMGPEANARPGTPGEVQQMKAVVREALAAGAFGFTTSFQSTHMDGDGKPIPSRLATHEEALELGSTLGEFRFGGIELITETSTRGPEYSERDQEFITSMALRSGRPVNWNELHQDWNRPTVWKDQLAHMDWAAKRGAEVYAVARCQRIERVFTLETDRSFEDLPTWKEVLYQPGKDRMALLRDPKVLAAMKAEASGTPGPATRRLDRIFFIRSKARNRAQYEEMTLGEISARTGKAPVDILLDWSIEDRLQAQFAFATMNGDLNVVGEMLRSPRVVAGISDAGAHVDRLSGANYTTFFLSYWLRRKGLFSLEDGIRRLTSMPAALYGLKDRGLIREGLPADIVVFDYDKVEGLPAERLYDQPGGEWRMGNKARGIEYLVVNGSVLFEGGEHTGALPGRLLRSGEYRGP